MAPRLSSLATTLMLGTCIVWSGTHVGERIRQLSLKDRVVRYYERYSPGNAPNDKKMEKLLDKYGFGEEHKLEAALKAKYGGAKLPPENYRMLFSRDMLGTSMYIVYCASSSLGRDLLPGGVGAVPGVAELRQWATDQWASIGAGVWAALDTRQKLALSTVAWAAVTAPISSWNARMTLTVIWLAAVSFSCRV